MGTVPRYTAILQEMGNTENTSVKNSVNVNRVQCCFAKKQEELK